MTEPERLSKKIVAEYYSQHREEVLAFVMKRIGNLDDSEDIVQTIFLRILCTDKMISEVTLPCLVYTVARNLTTDYFRRRSKAVEYEHYVVGCPFGSDCQSESSVYAAADIIEALEYGMARLDEHKRTIYRMNVIEGMKVGEISKCLDENYKSVENRLAVARREVRTFMRRMLA